MQIAIVGAGAIGGALAHALTKSGADPLLVARGAVAAAIRRDGLRVDRMGTAETSRPRVVVDTNTAGVQDVVIGTLKAQDWLAAADLFRPLIGPRTVILPALNGVPWWYFHGEGGRHNGMHLVSLDPDRILANLFPVKQLIGTVVYMAVSRADPGVLSWPTGNRLVLGRAQEDGGDPAPIAKLLRDAGMAIDEAEDIRHAVWSKLLGNASLNPVSALSLQTVEGMLDDPDLLAVCADAVRETIALAAGVGRPIETSVDARLDLARQLGPFRTSMLQDFEAGRALEIAAMLDAPIEIGRLVGVPTPVLETLARLTRAAVLRRNRFRPPA